MASIIQPEGSPYYSAYWRDAKGKPHKKTTKVRVVPEGIKDVGARNTAINNNRVKAQAIADEWERADKGNSDLGQSQKVLAEISDRRFPGHNLKDTPTTKMFLVDYLEGLIDAGKICGSTAKLYLGHLVSFLSYQGPRADLPVSTLHKEEISDYLNYEQQDVGNSANTAGGRWSFLYYAFETVARRFFPANPMADIPKPKEGQYSTRRPLEKAELPKLLTAALGYKNGREWVTIILFALYLGLRLSDAIRVKWSMINWEEGYIDYSQMKLKRLKKEERGPLHDDLLRWLYFIKKDAKTDNIVPVLASRGTSSLSTTFSRIVELAGIDAGAEERLSGITTHKVVFHSLRHTVVTWLDDLGVPETHREELVGHAGQRNHKVHKKYSHTRLVGLRRTVAKLPSVADGVIPLAKIDTPLPTSSGLLPDEVHKQFAHLRAMAKGNGCDTKAFEQELDTLQIQLQTCLRKN